MTNAEKLDWLAGLDCETCGGKGFRNHPEYVCPDCVGRKTRCWELAWAQGDIKVGMEEGIDFDYEGHQWMINGALQALCKRLGWEISIVPSALKDKQCGLSNYGFNLLAQTLLDAVYKAMGGEE